MGLLDKLKKKNTTERQQLEKEIQEKKEIISNIDVGLGDNFNKKIQKDLNQSLDDAVIEKYGTKEEKEELSQRKEKEQSEKEFKEYLQAKFDKAKRMHDINSIKIYREIIDEAENYPRMIISSYHEMMMTYAHIRQLDNAIKVTEECIEFKKSINEDYSFETRRLEFFNSLK